MTPTTWLPLDEFDPQTFKGHYVSLLYDFPDGARPVVGMYREGTFFGNVVTGWFGPERIGDFGRPSHGMWVEGWIKGWLPYINRPTPITPDDYLIAAWRIGAPNAAVERGFPRGFWPDVARTAVELALAGRLDAPLSFRPTRCVQGSWPEELRTVKGIDVSKLEFKL